MFGIQCLKKDPFFSRQGKKNSRVFKTTVKCCDKWIHLEIHFGFFLNSFLLHLIHLRAWNIPVYSFKKSWGEKSCQFWFGSANGFICLYFQSTLFHFLFFKKICWQQSDSLNGTCTYFIPLCMGIYFCVLKLVELVLVPDTDSDSWFTHQYPTVIFFGSSRNSTISVHQTT